MDGTGIILVRSRRTLVRFDRSLLVFLRLRDLRNRTCRAVLYHSKRTIPFHPILSYQIVKMERWYCFIYFFHRLDPRIPTASHRRKTNERYTRWYLPRDTQIRPGRLWFGRRRRKTNREGNILLTMRTKYSKQKWNEQKHGFLNRSIHNNCIDWTNERTGIP